MVIKNLSRSFTTLNELETLLENSRVEDSSRTLIQLFCADADIKIIKQIQIFFKNRYPNSILVGTTTDGVIEGSKVYSDTKSVVTFTSFKDTKLKSALVKLNDHNSDSFSVGQVIARELCSDDTKVIISFADGININGEEYVDGIGAVNPNVTLSGGLAADNGKLEKTYIFDKDDITSNGAVGVSLNSKSLNVSTKYTFDWMPVGKKLTVTKSIKNRVYEIDGISTVDIYAKYFGYELASQLPQVGIEFPLIFEKNGVSVGRAVLSKHNDGSLTFAGNVPQGTQVRFGLGSIERILQNSNYHISQILDEAEYLSEAVFIYSCMARRRFMKEHTQDELKILQNLGDISGFFTYGEFFHVGEKNQLLNETMTVLVLSESKKSMPKSVKEIPLNPSKNIVRAEHVLANLANAVSGELEELNNSLEQRIKESSDYIYKQAFFDKLTGLPNRLSLINKLRESTGQILFLINIDDFTTINDFYGHEIGDKVLKKLASVLDSYVNAESSQVFKLPSDEFAIIINIEHKQEEIEKTIKEYISVVEKEEFMFNGHFTHVTVTISAAAINKGRTGLINADMSLKLAKKAGKDFMIFDEDLKLANQYENNIYMANTIKNAVSSDGIIPYFQPIIDVRTGEVEKYESLVRLKKEDAEILSPISFLEISQKIKLYSQITEIMVEKSFSYFCKNGLNFSVNLALSDILNESTRDFIFKKIVEYGIAKQLTIEILETQEIDDEDAISKFIEDVYNHGAKIAIDDFGSGFANFQHMTTIHSDYMKIDGSLIKNIDYDHNARLVVETIVVFAKKLNKKTIAEFVHSEDVYDVVKELDIDFVQGYYLGKPLPDTLES